MGTRTHLLAMLLASAALPCTGQALKGKVLGLDDGEKAALPGASVLWLGTTIGTTTNADGLFQLDTAGVRDRRVVVSFIGFRTDTISATGRSYLSIVLQRDATALKEAVVTGDRPGAYIDRLGVVKTEVITQKELTKGACCDLAGCFGTQATVQAQTTNVVTNTKELRVLGIAGAYNQVLFDGQPQFQGLPFTYGISSLPGTLIENIYVAKGTTSVVQGPEGISGQINVEPRMPDRTDTLLVNLYANTFGERHANVNTAHRLGKRKRWSTLVAGHVVQPAGIFDRDDDGFLDLPKLTRYMLYNRWKHGDERVRGAFAHIGLRYWNEERVGGQAAFVSGDDPMAYGQTVAISQPELILKTGYRFSPAHKLTVQANALHHHQRSMFGALDYRSTQVTANVSLMHEWTYGEANTLNSGLSYRYQDLEERIAFTRAQDPRTYAGTYVSARDIPGAYVENTLHAFQDRLMWIAGARVDHHQRFSTFFTPRTMLRYAIAEHHILRASAGMGWRQVELFSENVNLLASSRDVRFVAPIGPEEAFTWGVDHTVQLTKGWLKGTLNLDFYQTRLTRQFFPDYDTDPTLALIGGDNGTAVSNAFQADLNLSPAPGWGVRLAYNYLRVQRTAGGITSTLPFIPTNRVMAAVSYTTRDRRWQFDANAHGYDRQRLPSTEGVPEPFARPSVSEPYAVLNAQVTCRIKRFDLYAGCENLFDFRQLRPIIGWQDPFGPYFDTASVWGPTIGREGYVGVRWRL
jgi:outer membrane receptor for ferrienterochelin and colicin